ncbi:hypothetical protein HanRHA438_Chr10g0475941 [Helianthus annuus]|uniref:Uncharacterized protein n=1 Tax=Helianthus annuus TaxID=4232 RepID=A0A9K3I1Q8_HELAN|nr:hypothetical protein HanXRQr2_Chr10g0463541 [Helianthus annuus]KAJ0515438.1 hypothetical protein HanHA300_Chr10g0380551 [Helianthus annuus]KAJ0523962.1 hypothetical protein HanIR_Chr10g0499411 [Helianthus annuus]KAJ0531628.1 hypothetical protein HanHA89_Chr10g0403091 [Helianthus annuus]KAJ0698469.1 hypothetical protein HanLR1_Chr10g0380311 [Helianthus annuus]
MAGSGSPEFITACFHTTSASGVICLIVTLLHTYIIVWAAPLHKISNKQCDSNYGWSMVVILVVQFTGVMIGTIAPLSRCFSILNLKVSSETISKHFKLFKVECYWTQKLYDWKHTSTRLPFRSHNLEVVIETLKRLIFNFCIGFQNGVVVAMCSSLGKNLEGDNDLHPYVLQLEDEIELGERTLEGLSKSVSQMIQQGAKNQPKNLMKLILGKSTSDFSGVKKFNVLQVI